MPGVDQDRKLRIWLCGELRLQADGAGGESSLTRRKSRELLGLLVDSNRSIPREELIELLWPEEPAGRRDAALRQLLTELRQCLGSDVVAGRSSLSANLPAGAWVDTRAAELAIAEARDALSARRWGDARELASFGLDLLAGEFLLGFQGRWIEERRAELEELELGALEVLAAAALSDPGHGAEAEQAARRLVSRAPFRESAHALLMRALVAEGNPGEALLAYERLRVLLREELGTVPSVGMSALHVWALEQSDRAPSVGQPPTLYARKSDGVSIAYQVVGQGPPDIAIVSGFMSHLDSQWAEPAYASWISRLASSARVITLDKAGGGASDPVAHEPSLREWSEDLVAVLDAVGSERAVLLGGSEAGAVSIAYANAHPERVSGLILYGAFARILPAPDYLWEHREEIRESLELFSQVERSWGTGASVDLVAPAAASTEAERRAWAIFERASGSPGSATLRARAVSRIDVRELLEEIRVPVLVIHRAGDRLVLAHHGRYLGGAIPEARYVELPGDCHPPHLGTDAEIDAVLEAIADFVDQSL